MMMVALLPCIIVLVILFGMGILCLVMFLIRDNEKQNYNKKRMQDNYDNQKKNDIKR